MILCPVNTPVCHARGDAPDCVFRKKSTSPHYEVEGLSTSLEICSGKRAERAAGHPALINPGALDLDQFRLNQPELIKVSTIWIEPDSRHRRKRAALPSITIRL
jgi:hypothetical protein